MDRDTIVVVTGLPRSGTSMMMRMLEAGGIPPLTDKVRKANQDNPHGYYEYERVKKLPEDTDWLPLARGKAVKVLAELVKYLPHHHRYKVIFMERDPDEMLESQRKMLVRLGKDTQDIPGVRWKDIFQRYRDAMGRAVEEHPTMDVLYTDYNELLVEPEEGVRRVASFIDGELDTAKMVSVIDQGLYRTRTKD